MEVLESLLGHKQNLPPTCGIYFLFLGDELQYIGQSVHILARLGQHRTSPVCEFDSYAAIEVPERDLCRVEREYIDLYKPPFNVVHNPQGIKSGLSAISRRRVGVVTPMGYFPSAHSAALAHDIRKATVNFRIHEKYPGWSLFSENDE